MEEPKIIWQVMVNGEVYEADTETFKQWAADGYVHPTDKVKKGNLNWTEAQNVPILREIFSSQDSQQVIDSPPSTIKNQNIPLISNCNNHPQVSTEYVCRSCHASLCRECVKFVGNIAICQLCGELCSAYAEAKKESARWTSQNSSFGFEDLSKALTFPLKDLIGLIAAAIIYGFLSMGGFIGNLVANGILFGAISRVIRRVSDGHTDGGWMPEFSSFWDDFAYPAILGLGIMAISYGPLLVTIVVAVGKIGSMILGGYSSNQMVRSLNILAGPIIGLFLITGLWALFYYPMALLVAGFTQNVVAVINPLVGFDTMRRMGSVYFKAFAMVFLVQAFGSTLNGLISFLSNVTLIAYVPMIGGVVTNSVSGVVTFYTSIVIAYILGRSLFKCADRLGI